MKVERKRAKKLCRDLLGSASWWHVNKKVAIEYGCETAIALADLINVEKMLEEQGKLPKDDWFFQSIDDVISHTGLSKKTQYKIYSKLRVIKFIEQINKGCPRRRWFRIDYEVILNYFAGTEDD